MNVSLAPLRSSAGALLAAVSLLACTPQQSAPDAATSSAPTSDPAPGQCLDIRPALVRCKETEALTHDGCAGEEYMKRCAPKTPNTTP